ncbi:MAG: UPF0147 family protein [Thermoplasmata archaeon]|nr:UPF0147 family protein [Thermoplasmata archaeon]MCI4341737.1 UPF0147 family protein [Thermoplasmata archaeon]
MNASAKPEDGGAAAVPVPMPAEAMDGKHPELRRVVDTLAALSEDNSVPRNIRRGAQAARLELGKPRTALDLRIASAVYVLDDLANDPNLPTHGRTALWSIMSSLESLQ